ncbi:hypothetical protein FACS1894187_09980 [Synergistales bacterium]|nr:hypothetical protein FACS1894187_09980 [Synergistales bacterium]
MTIQPGNFAFIDAQNLYQGVKSQGKFRGHITEIGDFKDTIKARSVRSVD